jgi:hypothetical protein
LSDGAYIPLQAKGRSTLTRKGEVHVMVLAESLADDSVVIVSGLIVDGGLGPTMLVIPIGDFRRLAESYVVWDRPIYEMAFPIKIPSHSKWEPWLVPSDRLEERFGAARGLSVEMVAEGRFSTSNRGFLGESEVVRRLAEAEDLDLFRPFPDLETAELVVRHHMSGLVIGLQVKTVTMDTTHRRQSVHVLKSSFRPAPTTFFTVLAWLPVAGRFYEDFLMFPSERLVEFAQDDNRHFSFNFSAGRLKSYRRPLAELLAATEELLAKAANPPTWVRP